MSKELTQKLENIIVGFQNPDNLKNVVAYIEGNGLKLVGDKEAVKYDEKYFRDTGRKVDIIWLDEEPSQDKWLEEANEFSIINEDGREEFVDENTYNYIVIKDFVAQQEVFCINQNGKIERNNIIKEFEKYCYENKTTTNLSREDIIKLVKSEYYVLSNTDLTIEEFFESLKPNKFKYRW